MGSPQLNRPHYSVAEYESLAQSAKEGERYEYRDGILISFLDEYTSADHNQVVQNAADLLKVHFYPRDCRVYTENVRLQVREDGEYRLPDVMVTCSPRDRESNDCKRDPVLLIEVLSPRTAIQDLAVKADSYRGLSTLLVYLVINPAETWVRVYARDENGGWLTDVAYTNISDCFTPPG
ncbi:MAG: Uma2 family endonuclease [Ferruginibacter sp.]|nr:Uma2 family endonuclease [Cytophagales bacterium]